MEKQRKLYLASLFFLIATIVFVILLVFIKISTRTEDYILVTRIFSKGISALFFYLAYAFSAITLTFNLLATFKESHLLKRMSFFIKLYFLIYLVTPFFTSVYYEYSHESSFFTFNLLGILFLIISLVLEGFALKNVEDYITSDLLVLKYKNVIESDFTILLLSGITIIAASFIYGDFYTFNNNLLTIIPIYYLPVMSLVFYVFNASRLSYLNSRYFVITDILNSRFMYCFIGYLAIIRLGYLAYSEHAFYTGMNVLRLVLFISFIVIVVFNSFIPKIDLSLILVAIIITLFTFEILGYINMVKVDSNRGFAIVSKILDYLILIFITLPYYIYISIVHLFLNRKKVIN